MEKVRDYVRYLICGSSLFHVFWGPDPDCFVEGLGPYVLRFRIIELLLDWADYPERFTPKYLFYKWKIDVIVFQVILRLPPNVICERMLRWIIVNDPDVEFDTF